MAQHSRFAQNQLEINDFFEKTQTQIYTFTELTVLFEHENHDGFMKGFTENYVRIKMPYNSELINKFVQVKIKEIDENICTTELIS